MLAALGRIFIDPDPICFKLLAAIFAPVPIRTGRSPHSQQQTYGQRGDYCHSSPYYLHD
jgi:hypothetical protein